MLSRVEHEKSFITSGPVHHAGKCLFKAISRSDKCKLKKKVLLIFQQTCYRYKLELLL